MNVYPIKCRISAEAGATRVDVYDDIGPGGWGGGLTAKDFAGQLASVKGPLEVHVNSGGGDVFDGIAIGNALRSHKGPVTTVVDGLAASIASVIAQAGQQRVMQPGSMMMIHDAFGACLGDEAEMRKMADTLGEVSDNIASIYAARAGGSAESWRAVMRGEAWYTAEDAVAAGLADAVGEGHAVMPAGLDVAAMVPGRIAARLRAAAGKPYEPTPYRRMPDETIQCPVCGKFNDTDARYCDQCGTKLVGREDVAESSPEQPAAALGARPVDADVDSSEWDASKAWHNGATADDPAAFYKGICAGRKEGDPSKQESWALPYRYTPSSPPNAAGVRNALARIDQTQGLTNKEEAKALLQRLMKRVNPDYEPEDRAQTGLTLQWTPDTFRSALLKEEK